MPMNCPLLLLLTPLVWLSFFLSYIKGLPGAERFVGTSKLSTLANLHNLLIQMVDHSQDITMLFLTRKTVTDEFRVRPSFGFPHIS